MDALGMASDDGDTVELNYRPRLPQNKQMGIGIVGAGEIVEAAHLPAYALAGFRVVGIFDVDAAKAQRLAARFSIGRTYATLDELLADDDVEVVDIAVPATQQLSVVRKVVERKKYLLCQKPLAQDFAQAKAVVEVVGHAGAKAAINQQMRWAPGIRASYDIIRRGWLGTLIQGTIQVNVRTPWDHWPWMTSLKGMEFMYHSIHYMDSLRLLLGTPEYVFADAAKFPGQPWNADTRTTSLIKFPGELRGLIADNHNNFATEDDWYATFRFEGTRGVIKGTNGALYNYPVGREDSIAFVSNEVREGHWFSPALEGKWFPHAFMGSMGELMAAIEEDREPENSISDNLKTLQMVFAAIRSTEEKRAVWLEEID